MLRLSLPTPSIESPQDVAMVSDQQLIRSQAQGLFPSPFQAAGNKEDKMKRRQVFCPKKCSLATSTQ